MKGKTKIMKDILKNIIIIIILFYICRLTVIAMTKLVNYSFYLDGCNSPFPEVDTISWWKLW